MTINQNVSFITDRELAIKNSVAKLLKLNDISQNQFICMLHLYKNVKRHSNSRLKSILKKAKQLEETDRKRLEKLIYDEKSCEVDDEDSELTELIEEDEQTESDAEKILTELKSLSKFKNDMLTLTSSAKSDGKLLDQLYLINYWMCLINSKV